MHAVLNNGLSPLSREQVHFMEMCCHILGMEYQDKAQQIGSDVVEASRGDLRKTIWAI